MEKALGDIRLGVLGAGVMGRTLINGILAAGLLPKEQIRAAVHTRKSRDRVAEELGIQVSADGYDPEWIADTDMFLICTKPYRIAEILESLHKSGKLRDDSVMVSIAAGVTISAMKEVVPNSPVIRAMPNTPCLIGAGATVISGGKKVTPHHMDVTKTIFDSVGKCFELGEHHMDAVTAVSGSGPAYAYLIMEALADGAVKVGLPRDMAFQLVSQTMLGSALMLQNTGKHPAMLKDEVTTPSGCTISALLTMEDGRIRSTLARAVEEATRTAAGLG